MSEGRANQQPGTVRIVIAIILLALATAVGIWVLTIVKATIEDIKVPAILEKIVSSAEDVVDINTPNGPIEVPRQFFDWLSYFILFLFLLIPTAITTSLIAGGVGLLKPDPTAKMMRGLVESIVKIQAPKE